MSIHPEHSHNDGVTAHQGANVNKTVIEISERTLSVVSLALAAAAIVTALWSNHEASIAEREARMLQYYVLEMDAKLIAAGIKKPEDSVASKLKGDRP